MEFYESKLYQERQTSPGSAKTVTGAPKQSWERQNSHGVPKSLKLSDFEIAVKTTHTEAYLICAESKVRTFSLCLH